MRALRNRRLFRSILLVLATSSSGVNLTMIAETGLQPVVQFPGPISVGSTSAPLLLPVRIIASGVSSSLKGVVDGTETGDYVIGSGGTCDAQIAYVIGQQCTASLSFKPQRPGLRKGAVVIRAADGTLLGYTLVSGIGVGSLQGIAHGNISTVAGNGDSVYHGDRAAATKSSFAGPLGVIVDATGNLYVSDTRNNRIRRIDASSQEVTTIAGDGVADALGDGGQATEAEVNAPSAIALDGAGNLYLADTGNHAIRRIDRSSGVITSVAGTMGVAGYSGDSGAATVATLSSPSAFAFDLVGNLIIADTGNNAIRRVDAATGTIMTIAGTGTAGFDGDGGSAITSQLNGPGGVAVGPNGLVYISDTQNNRVRRIEAQGTLFTVAGNGVKGSSPTIKGSTSALLTELNAPTAMAFDPAGRYVFSDTGNGVIREMDVVPNIGTIAGSASPGFAGDGGIATYGELDLPVGLSYGDDGSLYIADAGNNRIRRLLNQEVTFRYPPDTVGVPIGQTYLLIENHGNAELTLQTPSLHNAQLGSGTSCTPGEVITPAHGCTLFVEFLPETAGDLVTGSIIWPSDSVDSPSIFNLSGAVKPAQPALALTSSLNPSVFPTVVEFRATVASTSPSLSGQVEFLDGTREICRTALNASNSAQCSVASLTPGQHNITATYLGDANNKPAVSPSLSQVVKEILPLSLAASPNPALSSNPITLVSRVSSNLKLSGEVTFFANGQAMGTVPVASDGSATFVLSLSAGNYSLDAHLASDFAEGDSSVLLEVVNAQTTTVLSGSPIPGFQNIAETFKASVSPFATRGPGGAITFRDGPTSLKTVAVDTQGFAAFSTSDLATGSHTITALYSGTTNLLSSISVPVTLIIAAQDFSLATHPSITVEAEHHKNLNVTLTSIGDFSDRISVSCADLPLYATCKSSNGSSPLQGGTVLSEIIEIDTDAIPNFRADRRTPGARPPRTHVEIALVLLFPLLFLRKRHRGSVLIGQRSLGLLVLFFVVNALLGCSGQYPSHTAPGAYNIRVTGTGLNTGVTHTANVLLVVTK